MKQLNHDPEYAWVLVARDNDKEILIDLDTGKIMAYYTEEEAQHACRCFNNGIFDLVVKKVQLVD